MFVMFLPIFVADKKIIYGYNFVAPLNNSPSIGTKSYYWRNGNGMCISTCKRIKDPVILTL